jgi:sulfofructosephosphate aldolase
MDGEHVNPPTSVLSALARDDGTLMMVAMDQRESLRHMLAEATGRAATAVPDSELVHFKQAVLEVLSPKASAALIDPDIGYPALRENPVLADNCALILAADSLVSRPGEIVGDASFSGEVDLAQHLSEGVAAFKLLVVWREDGDNARRLEDARRFVDACRQVGAPSIVEGVVRATPDQRASGTLDREGALLDCARQLGALAPDLYKVEIPYFGAAPAAEISRVAEELTRLLPCPWVVLSSHVRRQDFPAAVEACCRGGASGVLAGRALWSNVLAAEDVAAALREESLPFLAEISEVVSKYGRPLGLSGSTP